MITPPFLRTEELHQPTLLYKITQGPILYNLQNSVGYEMSHYINDNINSFNNTNSFNNAYSFNNTNSLNINSFNSTNSFNVWNNYTTVDERSEILAWLSPLSPRIRHQDIRVRRIEEVGDWLLQTQEYRNWLGGIRESESDGSALFCYGGPGVGKTYIW